MSSRIAEQRIAAYLRAKDENRPHLMAEAFAPEVELEMVLRTQTIAFPPKAYGLDSVTHVLVRDFGRVHENVYSFCLQRPELPSHEQRFACDWLVAMSVRGSREVRVGCGRYEWRFQREAPRLVEGLRITIASMQVLVPEAHDAVFAWVARLPRPWCSAEEALACWPAEPLLAPVRDFVSDAASPREAVPA